MHTTLKRETDLDSIINSEIGGPHISIFLPVHPDTRSETINEDVIRFKNNLGNAKDKIIDSESYSDDLTKRINELEALSTDTTFWENQSLGLAIFVNKSDIHIIHLSFEVSEGSYIEEEFIVFPLLAMQALDYNLYVLNINTKQPTLYECTRDTVTEINDADLPDSLSDALQLDELNKAQQFHTGDGRGRAMFHGHGGNTGAKGEEVEKYLRLLANKVDLYLKKINAGSRNADAPLLLLGTSDRAPIVKDALEYDKIIHDEQNESLKDPIKEEILLKRCKNVIDNLIESQQKQLFNEIDEKLANELAVIGEEAIATACDMNNVERLLVPMLTKTNDSVRNGIKNEYKFMLPDAAKQWDQCARKVLACGADVLPLDREKSSDPQDLIGLCRFKLDLK